MEETPPPPARPPRRWPRILGLVLAAILTLFVAAVAGIDSGPGHRLIAGRIARLKPPTGLRIRIGRIDGSIWNHVVLRDVQLSDLRGRFFAAPEIRLDWHPLAWVHNRLDIDRLEAPLVQLARKPVLHGRPGQPLLPGFDIRIGALRIARAEIGMRRQAARLAGRADIRERRARIGLLLASTAGDRAAIDLDAQPDGDRFRLAGTIAAPAGGAIAELLGARRAIALRVGGQGDWRRWDGRFAATYGGAGVADLKLGVREGRYLLAGTLAPSDFLAGKGQRLTAPAIHVDGRATLADRRLAGTLALATPALKVTTRGTLDLARSAFAGVAVDARLLRPDALFPNMSGTDIALRMALDGPFRTPAFRYRLTSPRLAFDRTGFTGVTAEGAGRFGRLPVAVPIRLRAAQVTGVGAVAGGILADLSVAGVLHVDAKVLEGQDLALASDKLKGRLALRIDLVSGRFDVGLSGGLQRYLIPGLGIVDVDTHASVLPTPDGRGAVVSGTAQAIVQRFDNAFLKSLAGGNPRIDAKLVRAPDGVLHLSDLVLTGPAIRITGAATRAVDGSFQFRGVGKQASYGPFTLTLDGQIDHPTVRLRFERPVPALGLAEVALALDPVAAGFRFATSGNSTLGPFEADGLIHALPDQPTVIDVADLAVTGTHAKGSLRADPGGFTGRLDLAGGGIGGAIGFAPQGTLQAVQPHLRFARANLALAVPVGIRRGALDGAVLLDPAGTSVSLTGSATGLSRGAVTLARASLGLSLRAGRGRASVAVASAGARAFDLAGTADLAPDRIAIAGKGSIEGKPLTLDRPAVLTATTAGWTLAPVRVGYAGGSATLGGSFGAAATSVDAGLDHLPLTMLDLFSPRLALGGYASGRLTYRIAAAQPPTGRIDVAVRGLTRSGLVLSSTPVDVGLAAVLMPTGAAARAVIVSKGQTIGRAQARLGPLAPDGPLVARLERAPLFAQVRYGGPADTLWRLLGVETIDLSGPLSVAADIGGTPAAPLISGRLSTDNGRLESTVTGTVVEGVRAAGRFDGSRLRLDTLSGRAGGGTVTGTGSFAFGAGKGGLGIDLALKADRALLLNRDDLGATVTGSLTIRSDGPGGTVAGNVDVVRGRFRLGAAAAAQVARLPVTDVNQPEADLGLPAGPAVPWTLDLHAHARNQLAVTGLGLDSEWKADLTVRGPVTNPAIGGRLDLVRGLYQFAGRRFDLARGLIRFSGDAPPDPVLDITADANVETVNAVIHVSGTGLHPEISFESTPALPQDELLARLLFGTSVSNLSAPEALQLAAAVASLRGGGGGGFNLDPINAVRKVVRLDRLRILPADPTTGQKTAVAAGKYLGRKTYVELITDGQGYSATSIEYRITRWLSVLSTVSTIGRQSANVKISKDY